MASDVAVKQLVLALILSLASLTSKAEIGQDKLYHASYSFGYGLIASAFVEDKWQAFGLAMTPGLAKEILDSQKKGNRFSVEDLIADAIGASIGVTVGHTFFYVDKDSINFVHKFH